MKIRNLISGICAIIRYFATVSGHINLLGSKGCCLKVPSDFSHRSKLIEELIKIESNNDNNVETFENFEMLMSSDICQHNLEKAQRKLLKREGLVNFS